MSSTISPRLQSRWKARATQLDRLLTSVGVAVDLYEALNHAHRAARSGGRGGESALWELLESHVVSWVDALAGRVAELGGDPRVVLEPASFDTAAVDREQYSLSLAQRYGAFCEHLERTLGQPELSRDALTKWLYADLTTAAEIDRWFVENDLRDERAPDGQRERHS